MLPEIQLDDQNYKEIIEEMRNRIISIYPEWNDFNYHDPGVTLLELFAWIKEGQQYFLDQIGEENYKKFLKLLGCSVRHAESSKVRVNINTKRDITLNKGTVFSGDGVYFISERKVNIVPDDIKELIRVHAGNIEEKIENKRLAFMNSINFKPFGDNEYMDNTFYISAGAPLSTGMVYSITIDINDIYGIKRNPVAEDFIMPYPLAEIGIYIYSQGEWREINIIDDTTFGIVNSGSIIIMIEDDMELCEISGISGYFLKVVLKNEEYDVPPVIKRITFNSVRLSQKKLMDSDKMVFKGTGLPYQEYELKVKNICVEDLKLIVQDIMNPEIFNEWTRVEDFSSSGIEDMHFVIDDAEGKIKFGDGIHGLMPEGIIKVVECYNCEAENGNVNAHVINKCEQFEDLIVDNPLGAYNGAGAESVEAAIKRVQGELFNVKTVVTLKDYKKEILNTPGLMISDCAVISSAKMRRFGYRYESNTIVVVVKPYSLDKYPKLGNRYKKNIRSYLDDKMLLCNDIVFVQPEYIDITVMLDVVVMARYSEVEALLKMEIKRVFDEQIKGFEKTVEYGKLYKMITRLPYVVKINGFTIDALGGNVIVDDNKNIILSPNSNCVLKNIKCVVTTE